MMSDLMTAESSKKPHALVRKTSKELREKNDFYRTPEKATELLLSRESFGDFVWEPACGDGAISRVLERSGYSVISSDLIDRGYGISGWDFLETIYQPVNFIVTNPPFKFADEFVIKCFDLGIHKFAMFNRLAWLEGERRHKKLWSKYPPTVIYMLSKRLTLWRGDDPNPKNTGGAIPFAWYVWDTRMKNDGPLIRWIV